MQISGILDRFREFVVRLVRDITKLEDRTPKSPPGYMFFDQRYGTVSLSPTEAVEFREIVGLLDGKVGKVVSRDEITKILQEVIFKAIDIGKSNLGIKLSSRLDVAIKEASASFVRPSSEWASCIPIIGVKPPKTAWNLGSVKIVNPNGKELRELLKRAHAITDSTKSTRANKEHSKEHIRKELFDAHVGQPFAIVFTGALDAEAAWSNAVRLLRFTLDCLNLAIDLRPYAGRYYQFSDREPSKRHYRTGMVVNISDYSMAHYPSSVNYGEMGLDPSVFGQDMRKNPTIRSLTGLLRLARRSAHQDRILSAAHWAGRACAETRAEEAFLFRAIALESLILGGREHFELTSRLSMSIALLLGGSVQEKSEICKKVKQLYSTRSKIVHTGSYEVSREDSALLRSITLSCFTRVLTGRTFQKMEKEDALDHWFHSAMLRA